jgi:choline kinase
MDEAKTKEYFKSLRVIILAAGRGSRMGAATNDKPKGLTLFRGKPLIEWTLESLSNYFSKDQIYLVGGYKSESFNYLNLQLIVNADWEKTNIVGSLSKARDVLVSHKSLVIYSDIFFEQVALDRILGEREPAVLSISKWQKIWERRFNNPLSDLESFKFELNSCRLLEIGKNVESLHEVGGQFGGMFRITPAVWKKIESSVIDYEKYDVTTLIQKCIELGVEFKVVEYDGDWAELDSQEDLKLQE